MFDGRKTVLGWVFVLGFFALIGVNLQFEPKETAVSTNSPLITPSLHVEHETAVFTNPISMEPTEDPQPKQAQMGKRADWGHVHWMVVGSLIFIGLVGMSVWAVMTI